MHSNRPPRPDYLPVYLGNQYLHLDRRGAQPNRAIVQKVDTNRPYGHSDGWPADWLKMSNGSDGPGDRDSLSISKKTCVSECEFPVNPLVCSVHLSLPGCPSLSRTSTPIICLSCFPFSLHWSTADAYGLWTTGGDEAIAQEPGKRSRLGTTRWCYQIKRCRQLGFFCGVSAQRISEKSWRQQGHDDSLEARGESL